jgi:glycosyltransferase involved in cell wall biosynthesis
MSVKKYGVYLGYGPRVDLRGEGLGRYLACLIKGAEQEPTRQFVIACPKWLEKNLKELFESEHVDTAKIEILTTRGIPLVVTLQNYYYKYYQKKPYKYSTSLSENFYLLKNNIFHFLKSSPKIRSLKEIAASEHYFPKIVAGLMFILFLPLLILMATFYIITYYIYLIYNTYVKDYISRYSFTMSYGIIDRALHNRYFSVILSSIIETYQKRLIRLINKRNDVACWYAPTCFWPLFNTIEAPKILCVPDVVLNDFPVGFSHTGGTGMASVYTNILETLDGAENILTYSEHIKWNNVVHHHHKFPNQVFVIRHAHNDLSQFVHLDGHINRDPHARFDFCAGLVKNALLKSVNYKFTRTVNKVDFKFIFYPTQFRPNKNIMFLLQVYKNMLKKNVLSHKLILTGNPDSYRDIAEYIEENNLVNDVLFLKGLSTGELAACYALADLAICSTLSEGGLPFVFSEAVSVGTPTLLSDIPVTREAFKDHMLPDQMLFDPYDAQDLRTKILYCIEHRSKLLAEQKVLYSKMQRTWEQVAAEHFVIFDQLASQSYSAPIVADTLPKRERLYLKKIRQKSNAVRSKPW